MTAMPSAPPETGSGGLTAGEINILVLIERTGAGLSMVAVAIIIASYLTFKKLRTTPNLFLFCAAIANAGASVASMIRYDGLNLGKESALCQAQSFIFQWFMQADPWWSFAMAINVYLVFFHNIRPSVFRQYAWLYCLVCFGGPLITAVTLLSIQGDPRGPIFGDAVLWCWIDNNWSLVRIYSYYIPVWICILLSIVIYAAVGYHVFHHRNQLRNAGVNGVEKVFSSGTVASSDGADSTAGGLSPKTGFYGTAVTEVQITLDSPYHPQSSRGSVLLPAIPSTPGTPGGRARACVPIELRDRDDGANSEQHFTTVCSSDRRPRASGHFFGRLRSVKSHASLRFKHLDPVKMAYLRTSFIFAFAVLITWIPSSVNRLYSLSHDGKVSFQLSVASGCVLPLQGVWNALIYFTTSWTPFNDEMKALWKRWSTKSEDITPGSGGGCSQSRFQSPVEHRDTFERLRYPRTEPNSIQHSDDDLELGDYDVEVGQGVGQRH